MTNKLTRVIMQNIVEKCTSGKGNGTGESKMHIGHKEKDMIINIIHKENNRNSQAEIKGKAELSRQIESKNLSKRITLDELINKSVGQNRTENDSVTEKIKEPYIGRINKVSLEDIVPKVSLTSIGKKR